jgi:hypothetical protein
MNFADYYTKYFAYDLTKRCTSDSVEKLLGTLANSQRGPGALGVAHDLL